MAFYRTVANENTKKKLHKIENLCHKIISAELALIFNNNCIREKLCPKSISRSGPTRHTWTGVERIIRQRITEAEKRLEDAKKKHEELWNIFMEEEDEELINRATIYLQGEAERFRATTRTRHEKKLWILHGGPVRSERPKDGFINLTNKQLTKDQEKFLNYGLNCHYMRKPRPEEKRLETETFIDRLLLLQEENKISLSPTVVDELVGESGRQRGSFYSNILTKELREAAKQLREDDDIIIRKGDKAAVYVIMEKTEYDRKMDAIFDDSTKFKKLQKDPTEQLKKRINQLVTKANAAQDEIIFPKPIGDFSPGYGYGTVKTHKAGNPLRPIIAQMTSPMYKVAKMLNDLLVPYIPMDYALKSTVEFIDLLKTTPNGEDFASLDAESLFTNVPVDETISIILDKVYRSDKTPLPIPEDVLQALLRACTKEAPFLSHKGELYCQIDGVAMGSPLGVLFANMYMAKVEERTFRSRRKPTLYARYIDDIFVTYEDDDDLSNIQTALQENSVLTFTIEKSQEDKMPFLDVLIQRENNGFNTTVYTKPTNIGRCLNARGECPETYKRSVVSAYVNRALTHCSTWRQTHAELDRIRQLLTNNGYREEMVENCIRSKMDKFQEDETNSHEEEVRKIPLYYRMNYGTKFKDESQVFRGIIQRGVSTINPEEKLDLRIYCRPNQMASLVMRNCTAPPKEKETRTNIVYKFICPERNCESSETSYIGLTRTTLRRRMQYHRNQGAIFQHYTEKHDKRPTVKELLESTDIIGQESTTRRLMIAEAVSIKLQKPTLNVQTASQYVLPSTRRQRALDVLTLPPR